MPRRRWPSRLKSSSGLGDDPFATGSQPLIDDGGEDDQRRGNPEPCQIADLPLRDIVSERRASAHRTTMAVAANVLTRGIPRYGKAPASCWRERVDNAGASFAWRAPSSRPFEGTRVLTGYCTLVKGFGHSG